MPKVAPNINEDAAKFYKNHFKNLHSGATIVLDWFPELYKGTLSEMRGKFAENELKFMLKSCKFNNGYSGRHLRLCCENAIDNDGLDQECNINVNGFFEKIDNLLPFAKMVLEIFFTAFWRNTRHNKSQKEWIERLQ